jgi:hypothetical protein
VMSHCFLLNIFFGVPYSATFIFGIFLYGFM